MLTLWLFCTILSNCQIWQKLSHESYVVTRRTFKEEIMKKFASTLVLAVVLLTISATTILAADPSPIVNYKQLMELVDSVYQAPASKFLLKELDGPNNCGFRVVYVYQNRRYTLDYKWHTPGFQAWVRPEGSGDLKSIEAFSDDNQDGVVNFGTDGGPKIFRSQVEGLEYESYWQGHYNDAIAGLKATLQ